MLSQWVIKDYRSFPLLFQIAFRNGRKVGERFTDLEMKEVYLRHPEWLQYCGATEMTLEELAKEYASYGNKVLMVKEKK
jgi:hypothetical protein